MAEELAAIVCRYGWTIVDGVMTSPPQKPKPKRRLSKAQVRVLQSAAKYNGRYDTRDCRSAFILVELGLMEHLGRSHTMTAGVYFRLTQEGFAAAQREDGNG